MATEVAFLSEEQIDTLLREAEERLASKAAASNQLSASKEKSQRKEKAIVATIPDASKEAKPAKSDSVAVRVPQLQKKKDKDTPDNAGPDWFGLPKTIITPETKRDFQVLRMRGVIDTKQHFRKDTRRDMIPKFSAFGTIVEGSMDGKGSRLTRKERRQTIAQEVLASHSSKDSFKKRYDKIQERKTSGKKAFYKKLVAQRRRRP